MSNVNDRTHDEDLEWAESENLIEESTVLELISKTGIEPNFFNTMDWINNFYERTQDPTTELLSETLANLSYIISEYRGKDFTTDIDSVGLEQIDRLEKLYKKIAGRIPELLPYKEHFRFNNPLELFLNDISCGSYPPPEILMMLAKCFNLYFIAEGKLSLEEVFFGQVVKRSGNYSMRKVSSTNFKEFHYHVIREKQCVVNTNIKFNLEEFTLSYLKSCEESETDCPIINVTEDNIESFIVAYYRWKKNFNKQTSLIDKAEIKVDSINALLSLGYPKPLVEQVILKVFNNKLTAEETIKKALLVLMNNK
ncbi:RuvA C-terminal domain-containing protein [Colwellia piezophila]|uniref:RuvA C-terminal domain-containing protein n=1 Tax=Colwellia piezophila TaxID=211668 RepID=UPI0003612668|nr:RuvA C-terminal domain-containing protein [Colwellia piezophila]